MSERANTERTPLTGQLRHVIREHGGRLLWATDAPNIRLLAYATPRGALIVQDYGGGDGYDLYVPWAGTATPDDVARWLETGER